MKYLLSVAAASITFTLNAQLIFEENFDSGVLDGGWVWMGNDPVFTAGETNSGISKESRDLCSPLLAEIWQVPLMFHPLPLDTTLSYNVTADMRVENPLGVTVIANAELGWYDATTGSYLFSSSCFSVSATWEHVVGLQEFIDPNTLGPSAQWGLFLTVNYAATGGQALFDNIQVWASDLNTGTPTRDRSAPVHVSPNPSRDRLVIHAPLSHDAQVQVTDAAGRSVMATSIVNGSLDVSALASGVYQMTISDGTALRSTRFVRE